MSSYWQIGRAFFTNDCKHNYETGKDEGPTGYFKANEFLKSNPTYEIVEFDHNFPDNSVLLKFKHKVIKKSKKK